MSLVQWVVIHVVIKFDIWHHLYNIYLSLFLARNWGRNSSHRQTTISCHLNSENFQKYSNSCKLLCVICTKTTKFLVNSNKKWLEISFCKKWVWFRKKNCISMFLWIISFCCIYVTVMCAFARIEQTFSFGYKLSR